MNQKLQIAIEFGKRNQQCPEWLEFKAKWNGKQPPREGTAAWHECKADGERANAAQQKILDEIRAEFAAA